jgi:hypothetical protein
VLDETLRCDSRQAAQLAAVQSSFDYVDTYEQQLAA